MKPLIRFNILDYTRFKELHKELHTDPLFSENISNLKRIETDDEGIGYEVPESFWIDSAIYLKIIEIRKDSTPFDQKMFIGRHEVLLNGSGLEWVRALKGKLVYGNMGQWECMSCGQVQDQVYDNTRERITRPYICGNHDCGRKDSFKLTSPPHLQRPVWLVPGTPLECTESDLFDALVQFYRQHLVLNDHEYVILALWVMASWLVDDFKTCPYLALIAPKSSGKTQVLEAIRQTAYRAFATSSVTPAALFRSIELWHLTLCIDEAQDLINSNTETGQAIYACLLAGYKRGISALRAGDKTDGFTPEAFNLFGFKAFSGTRLVLDTLESRSIAFDMRKAKPKQIMMDEDRATELRSMLLWYRFTHLHKLPLRTPHECESGRLIELFTPLYTVEDGLGYKEDIDQVMDKMLLRDKEDERNTLEAEIMTAIDTIIQTPVTGTFTARSMILVEEIIFELAWDRTRKSSTLVGKRLKVLGIPTKHTRHGNGIDIGNPATLSAVKQLIKRYVR
jgi:hypothetical protein